MPQGMVISLEITSRPTPTRAPRAAEGDPLGPGPAGRKWVTADLNQVFISAPGLSLRGYCPCKRATSRWFSAFSLLSASFIFTGPLFLAVRCTLVAGKPGS